MFKKRSLFALLLALAMSLTLLSGCGGKDSGKDDEEFDDWPLTIKVWVCNTGNGYEYLQSAASAFNAQQDKYIIDLSYAGSYQDVLLKMRTSTEGSRPDIFHADTESMYAILEQSEMYVPIQQYIDADSYDMSSMMGNLEVTYTQDGAWQCMPLGNTVTGFFYNADALAKCGIDPRTDLGSYEEILEACRKLKANGYSTPFYLHTSSAFYTFPMTAQGIQYVDNNNGKDGTPTRTLIGDAGTDANKATVSFFNTIMTMADEGLMMPFGTTVSDARAAFTNGEMVFFTEFISSFNTISTAVGGAFEMGFHESPTIDAGTENHGQCTGGGSLFLANNGDKYKEQGAWEFMKFLMQDEHTSGFAQASGYLPTTISGYETAEYQNFVETTFPTAKYSLEAQKATDENCYNAWLPMFSDFHALCREFYTKAYNRSASAEDLTQSFAKAFNEVIELYLMSTGK